MVQHLVEDMTSVLLTMPTVTLLHTQTLVTITPSGVQSKNTILAGTYKFTPDEVEVFYLG